MTSNLPTTVKKKMRDILLNNGWMSNWHEDNLVRVSVYKEVAKRGGKTEYLGIDLEDAFRIYCKENKLNPINLLTDV